MLTFMRSIIHLCSIILVTVFCSCSSPVDSRLREAEKAIKSNPDSALTILNKIHYNDIKDRPRSLASFAILRGLANSYAGNSLITDTLLYKAKDYYESVKDSDNQAIASMLLAAHQYANGDPKAASETYKKLLQTSSSPEMQWDIHNTHLQLCLAEQDYQSTTADAQWLLDHTSKPEDQLKYSHILMAAQYMAGEYDKAVATGDSILKSNFMPEKYSFLWADFINDYAYALQGVKRYDDAISIMQDMMKNSPVPFKEEEMSRNLSMAEFHLNAGHLIEAQHYIDLIDDSISLKAPESYIKKGIIESVLEYKNKGHIPPEIMQTIPKYYNFSLRKIENERQTALENIYQLDRNQAELVMQRQRLWLVILSLLIIAISVGAIIVYQNRRKTQHLADVEEHAETLKEMLEASEKSKPEDKTEILRRSLLQQMGILKTFASSPTAQNQEALKKISAISQETEKTENLVDWNSLYLMIDELFDGFYSKLLNAYPSLFSDKEIQIICLIKADFSTKEIGVLTQQSSATIYVRKSSIRKKLSTPDSGDFIAQIDRKIATDDTI